MIPMRCVVLIINEISFKNYRNLNTEVLKPLNGVNIIYGKNAQGKTNLLELIWLFTGGRSFRGSKDADLISFLDDKSELNMKFFSKERDKEIKIIINKELNIKRTAFLNGVYKGIASTIIGNFCAVVFSPSHLSLIKDGPNLRRKFIDAAICQIKPSYTQIILKYNHVLHQRNAILKLADKNKKLIQSIDVWDESLAYYGSKIIYERIKYCKELNIKCSEIYKNISKNKEVMDLYYQARLVKINEFKLSVLNNNLKECLKLKRKSDIFSGFTSAGPHRYNNKYK